jgi:hypothetical protein
MFGGEVNGREMYDFYDMVGNIWMQNMWAWVLV